MSSLVYRTDSILEEYSEEYYEDFKVSRLTIKHSFSFEISKTVENHWEGGISKAIGKPALFTGNQSETNFSSKRSVIIGFHAPFKLE